MPASPEVQVPLALAGGILLLARSVAPDWAGWPRTAAATLELVGAGRSQSYDCLKQLYDLLPTLVGRPGRPLSAPVEKESEKKVLRALYDYVIEHPGAVDGTGKRRHYSDAFRRFVVGLLDEGQPGEGLSLAALATCANIPLATLKDWLHPPQTAQTCQPSLAASEPERAAETWAPKEWLLNHHLRSIITLWQSWKGTFQAFCRMVRVEQRLPYGATSIGNFLQSIGLRRRRPHQPVEAFWSPKTFRTFFPGAHWLGDGTSLAVYLGGKVFVFNLEPLLDPAADGLVSFTISDCEDEEVVRLAYELGKENTGAPPLFLSLDNRFSNHSPGTQEALQDTILLRSTLGRGQAKAPLEGAFGLFQQAMPPLFIDDSSPREMARSILFLIWTAWAKGRNAKPRKRLGGKTPAEVYRDAKPTPEQIQEALQWARAEQRRQERYRSTLEARRDPVRLELLTRGLAELNIPDSDNRLAIALAGFSPEAIVRGLAVFRSMLERKTLPANADHGRYLGGIIRRLNTRLELELTAVYLLEQRLRLRDLTLEPLQRAARHLRADQSPSELPQTFTDRALLSTYEVDFRFWKEAAANALSALPANQRNSLYTSLTRRIAVSFKTDRERREDLIDRLAQGMASAA